MAPTTLIMAILAVAFFPASWGYFWTIGLPKRRIANAQFLVMASVVGLMLLTLVLAIVRVQIVWLSWVLLATAILLLMAAMRLCRRALTAVRARDRARAEHMARGL